MPALFRVGLRYLDLQGKLDAAGLAPPIPTQHLELAANRARAALAQAGLPRSCPTE